MFFPQSMEEKLVEKEKQHLHSLRYDHINTPGQKSAPIRFQLLLSTSCRGGKYMPPEHGIGRPSFGWVLEEAFNDALLVP